MAKRPKTRGVILIHQVPIAGFDFWGAVLFKGEPVGHGLEVADKTLVSSIDRAGKTRETCEAKAREVAASMGYPDAEVRGPGFVPPAIDAESEIDHASETGVPKF